MLPEALQPVGIRVTADGKKAYVALGPANRVAVVDTATWEVKDYLLVGQRVWQLAFSPDEKFLYTTNGNSNDISVIDVATDKVVKSVQVGEQPWGVRGRRRTEQRQGRTTMKRWIAAALLAAVALPAAAQDADGAGGRQVDGAEGRARLRLRRADGAGQPRRPAAADARVGQAGGGGRYTLKSGTYYRIDITLGRHAGAGALGRRLLPGDLDQRDRHQRHRDPADGGAFDRVRRRPARRDVVRRRSCPGPTSCRSRGSHGDSQTATFVIQ